MLIMSICLAEAYILYRKPQTLQ